MKKMVAENLYEFGYSNQDVLNENTKALAKLDNIDALNKEQLVDCIRTIFGDTDHSKIQKAWETIFPMIALVIPAKPRYDLFDDSAVESMKKTLIAAKNELAKTQKIGTLSLKAVNNKISEVNYIPATATTTASGMQAQKGTAGA